MLVLTRKPGESIIIGDEIKIVVLGIKGKQAQLGIHAPSHVGIYREEIYKRVKEENKKAASQKNVDMLETVKALNKEI